MSTAGNGKIWGKFHKTVDNYVDSVDKGHDFSPRLCPECYKTGL